MTAYSFCLLTIKNILKFWTQTFKIVDIAYMCVWALLFIEKPVKNSFTNKVLSPVFREQEFSDVRKTLRENVVFNSSVDDCIVIEFTFILVNKH